MTIPGKTIDGWTIAPNYRSIKSKSVDYTSKSKEEWPGNELARTIFEALNEKGIQISRKRCELILEACQKDEYDSD